MALSALLALQASQSQPVDASKLKTVAPVVVTELDLGRLKGAPYRLAWSPDGKELYFQTREGDDPERAAIRHYVIAVDAKSVTPVEDEPQWASRYWTWKSAQSAPDGPDGLTIEVQRDQRLQSSTSTPMGGDLARGVPSGGTGGVSVDEVAAAGQQMQRVIVTTLWLKGQSLGEWVNAAVIPGETFGWAPRGLDAIAFVDRDRRLVIMDREGRKRRVDQTREAVFPAWSDDGARVAFLERAGRKKLLLKTTAVAPL